jgi:DNA-binding LytR/AlgR family response regulator
MTIKCIIVDDEPIARQILEKYCSCLSELQVVASCKDAFEAKRVLESNSIDLILTDVNMPVLDGLAFIKTLRHPPDVIFTTAYKEFAHDAFDVSATDYLLKPFSLERFMIAIDKVKLKRAPNTGPVQLPSTDTFIYVRSEGKIFKVDFDSFQYAEASGNYVKIVLDENTFSTSMTFTEFEELLPKDRFVRTHRSFIINKSKIKQIEGNRIIVGENEVPIGANYRESFLRSIGL